ncbi:MAG: sigma-70 family RNA polymerase sigma factor [Kiritimatiellae bacterium]|nr:sigma-70 family RNA polymerase sigma factor [Kiritimatiellia bacterium]
MNELTRAQFDLFAYIRILLRSVQDVSDVLQDTNTVLWKKRELYDTDLPFLPWAKAFAYQQVRAYRQKQSRSRLVFNDKIMDIFSEKLSMERYSVHASFDRLESCIEKLPERQRKLINARYHIGEPLEVLARNMKCSVNAVSILLCRTRQALLDCLFAETKGADNETA